jgi:hypothetical protein
LATLPNRRSTVS